MLLFQGWSVLCAQGDPSLPDNLQEAAILLAHFAGFFKSTGTLNVETEEVLLNVQDVIFEIPPDEIRVTLR